MVSCTARKRKPWNLRLTANLDRPLGVDGEFELVLSSRSSYNKTFLYFRLECGGRATDSLIVKVKMYSIKPSALRKPILRKQEYNNVVGTIVDPRNNDLCKSATLFLRNLSVTTRT